MKKFVVSIMVFCCLLVNHAFAQLPANKQMQAQMLEAVNELNKQIADLEKQIIDAKRNREDTSFIKDLEDQKVMLQKQVEMMGGVTKKLANMPDKIVRQAIKNDSIQTAGAKAVVPRLDKTRIDLMPKDTLNDADLTLFIKKVHAEVERIITKEEKEEASRAYAAAKSLRKTSNGIGNISTNLYLSGHPAHAIYLLGKECASGPKHANNLNNYAALLIMAGGEQAAIPILQNLNQNFPNNSTILNNLGQAWYGLGDMNKAKKYLDLAIALFEDHPQANQTKCWIQKSEGDNNGAIESLKRSIREVYTTEKDHLLDKLGGKLSYRDFKFPYYGKPEPLGVEQFIRSIPEYPFEGGRTAERSRAEWYEFKQKVNAAREVIDKKMDILKPMVASHHSRMVADPKVLEPFNNHVHITARRKLMLLSEWAHDRMISLNKEFESYADSLNYWRREYDEAMKTLENCGARKDAATAYLSKANLVHEKINTKRLNLIKAHNNTLVRLVQYTSTDESEYKLMIESFKAGILTFLFGMQCDFEVGCVPSTTPPQTQNKPLPDFDSVNCQYADEIYIPPFTVIKTECNIMTTEIDFGTETLFPGFEVKIKLGMTENLNSGKITKGTLEIGVEAGVEGNIGPVQGELKGGLAAGIEVTGAGIKEVYLVTTASAELTGHIDEEDLRFVDEKVMDSKGAPIIGAEAKISWNAGPGGDWGFENYGTSGEVSHFLKPILMKK
jgi:tetratricopeptide (TPR) repeat protein